MRRTQLHHRIWIISLIIGIIIALQGINLPYTGLYNANNNYLALASKNFIKFGFATLNFLPTYFVGRDLPESVPYYLHHPTLMFLFEAVPFVIFGVSNWVVHVAPFVFTAASLWALYALVRELVDSQTAKWSVAFGVLFPFVSFFWKFMMFEAASLLFTLFVLFFSVRYWKTGNKNLILLIGVVSFLGGATDWYGAYLFFGFLYVLYARKSMRVTRSFIAYVTGTTLGFATYLLALYGTGNLGAVWEGYSARGFTSELMSLDYWPFRLLIMTLVRLVLYGSPFVLFGIWYWIRKYVNESRSTLLHAVGAILVIIGTISLVVLPTTVWGHSYFLYYLVPFLALSTAMWFVQVMQKSVWIAVMVLVIQIVWSAGIQTVKIHQVAKQAWKYTFGQDIARIVPRYSTIGVLEYPGDVLQNYFSLQTKSMTTSSVETWSKAASQSALRHVVVTCSGACTAVDTRLVESWRRFVGIHTFEYDGNTGWLLDADLPGDSDIGHVQILPFKPYVRPVGALSPIEWAYRKVRDILGSTQI